MRAIRAAGGWGRAFGNGGGKGKGSLAKGWFARIGVGAATATAMAIAMAMGGIDAGAAAERGGGAPSGSPVRRLRAVEFSDAPPLNLDAVSSRFHAALIANPRRGAPGLEREKLRIPAMRRLTSALLGTDRPFERFDWDRHFVLMEFLGAPSPAFLAVAEFHAPSRFPTEELLTRTLGERRERHMRNGDVVWESRDHRIADSPLTAHVIGDRFAWIGAGVAVDALFDPAPGEPSSLRARLGRLAMSGADRDLRFLMWVGPCRGLLTEALREFPEFAPPEFNGLSELTRAADFVDAWFDFDPTPRASIVLTTWDPESAQRMRNSLEQILKRARLMRENLADRMRSALGSAALEPTIARPRMEALAAALSDLLRQTLETARVEIPEEDPASVRILLFPGPALEEALRAWLDLDKP